MTLRTDSTPSATRLFAALFAAMVGAAQVAAGSGSAPAANDPTPQHVSLAGAAEFQPSPKCPVGWLGDGSGRYPAANPADTWSAKANLAWTAEVGQSHSSPIVVGRRVFVMSEPDVLICLDASSGKELWRRAHAVADLPAEWHVKEPNPSKEAGQTTPTPVSDGKWIWIFIDSGVVACYDLEGKQRWIKWYDFRKTTSYGRAASPVLAGERLLVHFGPLVCLEAATGKLLWKNDAAKATYGTPATARIGNVEVAITPKGQVVRLSDGKTLASGLGNCAYPSPVVRGRIVYFIDRDTTAVELPAEAGDKIEVKELWSGELDGEFFTTPLIQDGRIYAVDKAANYFVLDAVTGKTLFSKVLDLPPAGHTDGPIVYPSICLAGKHLFLANNEGDSMVLETGEKPAVVAANSLPTGAAGTPTFSGTRMYVRGGTSLYCIAKAKEKP